MADSVGSIGLDLVVNRNDFDKQMSGIQNVAKKAGAALAAAFGVKKLVDFGKECLELGSDLEEVQNVVDVTFPNMASKVDEFAKSAAAGFGLSETMAKQFTGTFGAMAKSFGFSESAAYEMGSALTGLAGDVASFYNISQDEAYTKLKSVFTGETETLKDLGVVMTQNALDAYAMANGFGKITAEMSEAEKVALRYQFVQDKLAASQGDFARTSGSWANQVRILKLQFDSLKAGIGQGLINLFTPIIQVINTVLGKLATLANAFKSFTELITGNKSSGNSLIAGLGAMAEDAGTGFERASGAADGMASSADKAGKAAKKAAEEMKALMGFDKINKLQEPGAESNSGGSGGGAAGGGGAVDFGSLAEGNNVLDAVDDKFQGLIERCRELAGLFKKGFFIGFGDSEKRIQSIQEHIKSIGKSLKGIFTDSSVTDSANKMFDAIAFNAGKAAGSFVNVGLTIADNLVGGIDLYLQGSSEYIKDRFISMFDAAAGIAQVVGDFSVAFADIFTVFSGDNAKACTAAIIGMFSDGFLGVLDISLRLGRDILDCIAQPIIENKDKVKLALENTLAPVSVVLAALHGVVKNTFESLGRVYDENLKPAFEKISSGFSTVFAGILDAYNAYLAPALDWIGERFTVLIDEHLQPLIDAFMDFAAKVIEALAILWDFLSPFVAWLTENFIEGLAVGLVVLWEKFESVVADISDLVKGLLEVFSGILDFIIGVFTGDWERAWNGINEIFKGIMDAVAGVAKLVWDLIGDTIKTVINKIKDDIDVKFSGIKTFISGIWDTLTNITKTTWNALKGFIEDPVGTIKRVVRDALDAMKSKFSSTFGSLGDIVRAPVNQIIRCMNGMINAVASGVNGIASMLNSIQIDAPQWVTDLTGVTSLGFNLPMWTPRNIPYLAQGGFVKANTPRLAMIGDNRHYGEVVAPEDKMQEMVNAAVRSAAGSGITKEELEALLNQAVSRIIAVFANIGFYLDGEELARLKEMAQQALDIRYNNVTLK